MKKLSLSLITLFVLLLATAYLGYTYGLIKTEKKFLRPSRIAQHLPPKIKNYKPLPAVFATPQSAFIAKSNENSETELMQPAPKPESMDTLSLSRELSKNMGLTKALDASDLARNVDLADQLLTADPEIYSAYKSKMINLLLLETKFQKKVDIETYETLMEDMLSFSGINAEDEILNLLNVNLGKEILPSEELEDIDHELIHIPFMRFAALKDYENLADISVDYIEQFPNSYLGYLYLAESFWRRGDQEAALDVLSEKMQLDGNENIVQEFIKHSNQDPISRIEQLHSYFSEER